MKREEMLAMSFSDFNVLLLQCTTSTSLHWSFYRRIESDLRSSNLEQSVNV